MLAKVYYRKDRDKYIVQLYWQGKPYKRSHYDDYLGLINKAMADQIAGAINADIRIKGKDFDPRQWFRTSGFEFRFDQYVQEWLPRQTHYAPSVHKDVKRYAKCFTEFFGQTDIRQIKKGNLVDFIEWLPSHLAPKTKANILGLLHKLFSDAFESEILHRIPGWPRIEVPEPEIKWITRKWQDKIIAKIPVHDRPIFIFIRTWGIRPGEARALKWDCVDFEKEIVIIKRTFSGRHLREYTKTKRIRYLPFTDELKDIFIQIRGLGGYVFRNRHGRPYADKIAGLWRKSKEACDCPYESTLYQDTRHSFATQHIDQLDLVRQVLGHSRTDMTRRYQGLNLEPLKEMQKNIPSIERGRSGDGY